VLARFAYAALPSDHRFAILAPIWVLAALSMLVGNLGALAQTDMKRLLAYSGIAQVGYVVVALAGTTALGLRYALLYLAGYTFMNLGAFAVVALMSREGDAVVGLPRFAGLAYRRPWLAAAMTFFLIGLAGLPPTIGFTGKILILAATVGAGYAWLGGVLILGTAISAYVYFKIVRVMFVHADPKHVRDETVIEGTRRVLRAAVRAPKDGDVFLIAEDERGERTGFAYVVTVSDFFTGEPYAHVSEVAVARSGAGVGGELMEAAERWARERGYRMISLNVVEENLPGRRFYERRGYGLGHRHYVKRL
jgi:NADH:ubiquinone oxidoreductase subunit 5 (subunit L)/multisubunit Na+/H+ antiporter MnhA subunit